MKKHFFSFLLLLFFSFSVSAQKKEAQKFDEFGDFICDDLYGRFEDLNKELKRMPKAAAFIVVYEGKYLKSRSNEEKYVLPRFGESVSRTKTMQTRLFTFLNYDPKKYIFINGGFREKFTIEFWIVPDGAPPPKPTPTLEKIKYRKGTPKDICRNF